MGEEKRYYWLKLKDDFFKSRKMKKLRKVAGGDTYTIIYLKLQLLSINNDGIIEFEGTDEDIFHQLALDIDEEIDDIKMTVAFCTANDLIEYQEQDLFLSDVPELIGSEAASTRRSRKHRQRKALEAKKQENKAFQSNGIALHCNSGATKCNTEIDIDKDIDIENRDIYSRAGLDRASDIPYKKIVEYLNAKTGKSYKSTTAKTKDLIKARFNDGFTFDDFKIVIDNKVLDWANDDEMSKYLRPETLFSNKFEGYLNENPRLKPDNPYADYADKARAKRFEKMMEQ